MPDATNLSNPPSRRRRFPLTLAAVAASAIAIPVYLVGASAPESAEAGNVTDVVAQAEAPVVAGHAKSEPAASTAVAPTPVGAAGDKAAAEDMVMLDAAPPSPASAPHRGLVETEAPGDLSIVGKSAPAPSKKGGRSFGYRGEADRGDDGGAGFEEQLRVNRLTAGRTSDLDDRTSIDALRALALTADPALRGAIKSNKAVGAAPKAGQAARVLDIGLVLDTTGSMGDELAYLKVELRSIAQAVAADFPGVTQRYALVAYRDHGDQYVVRHHDFAPIDEFIGHLGQQSAGGGGDHPEAMDDAMLTASQLQWSSNDAAQMVFLVADAPPHTAGYQNYVEATGSLGARGVAVYPVASSGVATVCEYLMRWAARTTGGQYLFLTDHSGVGSAHAEAHVEQYELKTLRDHMLEVIRLELGADGDIVPDSPPDLLCATAQSYQQSWFDRHGVFAMILGGVFVLGFAIDMAMSHARRRA